LTEKIKRKLDPSAFSFLGTFKAIGEKIQTGKPYGEFAVATLLQNLHVLSQNLAKSKLSYPEPRLPQRTEELIMLAKELPRNDSPGQVLDLYEAMYKRTSKKEKLLVPEEPLKSRRSNRDPRPAFEKFMHRTILETLHFFGGLPKTKSDFSEGATDPKPLTNEEVKKIFDVYCSACRAPHNIEAVKKLKTRFLDDLLTRASNYKNKKVTKMRILA